MRTGILGGTFDPIHIAHLHAGETALRQVGLDRVLFMPAGDPWQKEGRWISPSRHRIEMTRMAVAGVPGFHVDERELARKGPTFTLDTLATFPNDEELYLILGADSASRIRTWHRWEEVLDRAGVIVVPRPGTALESVRAVLAEAVVLDSPALDISSTMVRSLAAAGGAFRFLVPEPVFRHIVNHGLYSSRDDRVGASTEQEGTS